MSILPGYLLLSYGPRHARDVTDLPAAAQQLRSLRRAATKHGAGFRILDWDYARKICGRNDLPRLFKLLETCREQTIQNGDGPKIIIDDYSRVFRITEPNARADIWAALSEYADHFRDLRQGKPLNALSPEMTLMIKCGALPPERDRGPASSGPNGRGSAQTQKARMASAVVRSRAADRAARDLARGLQDYRQRHPGATVKAFLESGQGRGLRNSQGRPWTYRSALRVLRVLNDHEEIRKLAEGER